MKKVFGFLLFASFNINAQVTLLQANHAPAAGDSYQTYQCDSLNVVPGPSGAGQHWNFVIATHSSMISSFNVAVNSNAFYSAATVSLTAPANNNSYFDSDINSLRYYGGHFVIPQQADVHLHFTTPAIYASYPMALNSTTTSTVAGTATLILPVNTTGTFTGNCIASADGSGTLSLPGITYNNILRVVKTQTIDCVTGFGNGVMYQETYDYYQGGIKPPVFTISSTTVSTPLGDDYQFIVSRLVPPAITVGLAETHKTTIESYPNPSSDKIQLKGLMETGVRVTFLGSDGSIKLIQSSDTNGFIDVSSLAEGVYIYQVQNKTGKVVLTGRQVIVR